MIEIEARRRREVRSSRAVCKTLLAMIVVVAVSTYGCSGSGGPASPTTTPTPSSPPSPGSTPTATPGGVQPVALCAQAPTDQLCSFLPQNVIAPNLSTAGYSQLGAPQQRPFDNFSWESFVALNWPAMADGTPIGTSISDFPDAPRVWNSYPTSLEVFDVDIQGGLSSRPSLCAALGEDLPVVQMIAKNGDIHREPSSILQATGQPVIDRNLNFVLYDIRVNPVEANYVESNGLNTVPGQMAFQQSGQTVSFPTGYYTDDSTATGGSPGAIEVKTAWRILDTSLGDDPSRFYTQRTLVYVSASASQNGEAFCFAATLGLVGMHIIQRTSGPQAFGLDWIWSTFEHVDNAPLATNAGDPTSFDPVPTPCVAPTPDGNTFYSFYNPGCSTDTCPTNQPPPTPEPTPGVYQWATSPPYAKNYATNQTYGTQVVKCWNIYDETQAVNAVFRAQLAGTVWANYELINTQWQGGIENPVTENGNIPRFLGNPVLETYIQNNSSCLQCHAYATTTTGQDANFSFLLGLAQANLESMGGQ